MTVEQKLKNAGVNVDLHRMKTINNLHTRYVKFGHNISVDAIVDYICDRFVKQVALKSKGGLVSDPLKGSVNKEVHDEIVKDIFYRLHHMKLTPVKKTTKVHRNMPCPCGSKKKYKKCCINKN